MKRLLTILFSFFVSSMLWAENTIVSNIYSIVDLDYSKNYKGVKQIKVLRNNDELESVAHFDKEGRLVSDSIVDSGKYMVLLFYYGKETPAPQINDSNTCILFHFKDDKNITMKFYNAPDMEMGDSVLLTLNSRKDLTKADYYLEGSVFQTFSFQTSWTADGNSCATKRFINNELQGKVVTTYKNKKLFLNKGFDASGNQTFEQKFNAYGDLTNESFSTANYTATNTYKYDSKGHWISKTQEAKSSRWGTLTGTKTRQIVYY